MKHAVGSAEDKRAKSIGKAGDSRLDRDFAPARGLYFLKNNTNGKKEVIKIEQMVRKRRKPLVKKHKSIQEICRLARKNGMSYGEYVSKTKQ